MFNLLRCRTAVKEVFLKDNIFYPTASFHSTKHRYLFQTIINVESKIFMKAFPACVRSLLYAKHPQAHTAECRVSSSRKRRDSGGGGLGVRQHWPGLGGARLGEVSHPRGLRLNFSARKRPARPWQPGGACRGPAEPGGAWRGGVCCLRRVTPALCRSAPLRSAPPCWPHPRPPGSHSAIPQPPLLHLRAASAASAPAARRKLFCSWRNAFPTARCCRWPAAAATATATAGQFKMS